jgi:putative intracellular protease/amidase
LSVEENKQKKCALIIIADGFEETGVTVFLSLMRQAGLYVKSVGLTSGLISSVHGVWLMPDLTLTDLDLLINTTPISVIILPEGRQSLARLESDPRVHRLLRQVVAQRGKIVASQEGLRVLRAAALWGSESGAGDDVRGRSVLLREPGQSVETFARDLMRKLMQPPWT